MAVRMCISLLLLSLPALALQAVPANSEIGRVIQVAGGVQVLDATGSVSQLGSGGLIFSGDTIQTLGDGHVRIRMVDRSLVTLRASTEFEFVRYVNDGPGGSADSAVYHLHSGCMSTVTGTIGDDGQDEYRLASDHGEVRIRGTTYECRIDAALSCSVYSGAITLSSEGETLDLGLGADYGFGMISAAGVQAQTLLPAPPQLAATDCGIPDFPSSVDRSGTRAGPAFQVRQEIQ